MNKIQCSDAYVSLTVCIKSVIYAMLHIDMCSIRTLFRGFNSTFACILEKGLIDHEVVVELVIQKYLPILLCHAVKFCCHTDYSDYKLFDYVTEY